MPTPEPQHDNKVSPSTLFQVVVGLLVSLCCVAGVPFAISVSSRLASIETALHQDESIRTDINDLRGRIQNLEIQNAAAQAAAAQAHKP